MKIEWVGGVELSDKARDLVEFDMASIRQVVAGRHGSEPDVWVVSTPDYESGGRVLRDTPHTRMVAYAVKDRTIYGTDGCNACATAIDGISDLPAPLQERLNALIRPAPL